NTANTAKQVIPITAPNISSQTVGFVVYNHMLLSVSDEKNMDLEQLRQKLLENKTSMTGRVRNSSVHVPSSPDELMLYLTDTLVGNYSALRHDLSQKLEYWQATLMNADKSIPSNYWEVLFKTRNALYLLDDLYEDQSITLRAWQESVENDQKTPQIEILSVRARDVIEHIERIHSYVNRLQAALESAIQIHFSATSNQTNQVMRILTVITAIFLPMNLLTGLFGMNFEGMFMTKYSWGFWLVVLIMCANTIFLIRYFLRKRYLR
ncbi:MAG: CorA family divalent cation transporter, partial [Saezia sp.]